MDKIYFLGWSLNMTSTCLEHKTRITQVESRMEKKSLFHDVTYAMIGNYWLVNYDILWKGWSDTKNYFNLEIDRHLSLGPSWMAISDYLGGYLPTKTPHFCCILSLFYCYYYVATQVANLDLLVLRKTGTCHKLTPGSRLATIDTTARVYASS